ncbi:MAG: hypothetical protein H6528_05175 [Actinobacteria bacterium]|nr:hypothetical protein [Actinomycetota bacterium]MCB8996671.1 hypothetical protein [Actinomycetota bacterium]
MVWTASAGDYTLRHQRESGTAAFRSTVMERRDHLMAGHDMRTIQILTMTVVSATLLAGSPAAQASVAAKKPPAPG